MTREFFLNQLRAGDYSARIIDDFFRGQGVKTSGLDSLIGRDGKSIAREICLATVACTAVNFFLNTKVFGDNDGGLSVGDFYRVVLPWHKVEQTIMPAPYDMGWRIVDVDGNVFHHAVAAFLKIFGVKAYSLIGFPNLEWIMKNVENHKVFLALSLDNKFVSEKTLDELRLEKIRTIYPDFGSRSGRHIVGALQAGEGELMMMDSFQLLEINEAPRIFNLDFNEINKYFDYQDQRPKQSLVFSQEEIGFPKENLKNIFIPDYVEKDIEILKKRFLETNTL